MWRKILLLVGSDRKKLPMLFFMFLLLSTLELVSIGLLIPIINYAVFGTLKVHSIDLFTNLNQYIVTAESPILLLGLMVLGIFTFKAVGVLGLTALITQFAQNQRVRLGRIFLQKYLGMDYIRYLSRRDSDGVYEVQIATTDYFTALQIGLKFLGESVTLALLMIMLLNVNPLLTSILFLVLLIATGSYAYFTKNFLIELGVRRNKHESRVVEICQNAFRGFREIRLLNKSGYFVDLLAQALMQSGRISVVTSIFGILPRQFLELLIVIGFLTSIFVKGRLGLPDDVFLEIAAVYLVTALRMLPLVTSMTANYSRMRTLSDSIDRIFFTVGGPMSDTVLVQQPAAPICNNTQTLLYVDGVSYSYEKSGLPVLKDINLNVKYGEIVGIVGNSGSGKTTLLGLVSGFLAPSAGKIEYGLSEKTSKRLNNIPIAYLPQDAVMINGSVRENIILSHDNSSETRNVIHQIINRYQLEEMVKGMPEGIDCDVGQSGARLSAGQRQRLALARVAYHDTRLLILDEATNAIDIKTEKLLFQQMESFRKRGAIIVVSHRQSTLDHCDRVLLLDNGKLSPLDDYKAFFESSKRDANVQ